MVDRKKIQCSGTLASVTPMTSSTCGTCMGSTQSLVSSTPGGLKKTNSIQKGDNCLFQNPERDQNWIRMLELWTNFIKHLDPTPSDHLSEVLGNVSWTQVRPLLITWGWRSFSKSDVFNGTSWCIGALIQKHIRNVWKSFSWNRRKATSFSGKTHKRLFSDYVSYHNCVSYIYNNFRLN